jgi:mono/diheme cytochrome c family protein
MTGRRLVVGALAAVAACLPLGAARAQGHSRGASERPQEGAGEHPPDELQPTTLPPLPVGMTLEQIGAGDAIFHGRGGCFACHGAEGEGLAAAGDGLSVALFYARPEWRSIDSLVTVGLPDALTRSPIAMPARGARGDLTRDDIARVAAYVWAISQTRGEPWPGGHASHAALVPPGSTQGTAQAKPWRTRGKPVARP